MTLSAIVHTYNAEKYLDACLESLQCVDEIVVCDMYSTDATIEIAQRNGARIIYFENCGIPEPARAFAISQASSEWILVVDADEIVPKALLDYLKQKSQEPNAPAGIIIPRKNMIFGKFLRCTYPDYHVRFFLKSAFDSWPGLVHRGAVVKGTVETIPAKMEHLALIHYNYDDIEVFIEKMNRYTTLEIEKLVHKKINCFPLTLILRPIFEFIKRYILKKGFLDGYHGFIFACLMANYKFVALSKLWMYKSGYTDQPTALIKGSASIEKQCVKP